MIMVKWPGEFVGGRLRFWDVRCDSGRASLRAAPGSSQTQPSCLGNGVYLAVLYLNFKGRDVRGNPPSASATVSPHRMTSESVRLGGDSEVFSGSETTMWFCTYPHASLPRIGSDY